MPEGLGLKRLDHVAFVVEDADRAVRFFQRLLGIALDREFTSPSEGFRGALLDLPNKQAQFEVLEPHGDTPFLRDFLAKRGPGVHHITLEVEDVEAAVRYLRRELGIEPFRGVWSDGDWKQTFIHPRDTGGILFQLFEWLPGKRPPDLPDS